MFLSAKRGIVDACLLKFATCNASWQTSNPLSQGRFFSDSGPRDSVSIRRSPSSFQYKLFLIYGMGKAPTYTKREFMKKEGREAPQSQPCESIWQEWYISSS